MKTFKNLLSASFVGLVFFSSPLLATTNLTDGAGSALPVEASHQQFEQQIRSAIAPFAGKEILGLKVVYLSGDVGPWMDTGLALQTGDRVTTVLNGKVWMSRAANLSLAGAWAVWERVGVKGSIFRGTRNTNTFASASGGSLHLKLYPGERWLDTTGKYLGEPAPINPDAGGGVSVAIIKWGPHANIQETLRQIADKGAASSWAQAEIDRQKTLKLPPPGWQYIPEFNTSEIFSEVQVAAAPNAPARAIELHMHDDATIVEKTAPIDLTADTTLSWKWKAIELPSLASENTLPTHDYMSIAVKFDNGKDLTFYWSRDLPVDTAFHCPLPGWSHRETHVVARSGTDDLGKWISEEKNILAYYKSAIGGPLPKKITHVWLIGVSLFQHTEGASQFGEIELKDRSKKMRVF